MHNKKTLSSKIEKVLNERNADVILDSFKSINKSAEIKTDQFGDYKKHMVFLNEQKKTQLSQINDAKLKAEHMSVHSPSWSFLDRMWV